MKPFIALLSFLITICACTEASAKKIDRKAVVDRHQIVTTKINSKSPAQVGNGQFAFGVDMTGLQTFVPFNTLSDWSWHSFPLPDGASPGDFKDTNLDAHGRQVPYNLPNPKQKELSDWLSGNPHRFNLGRIGFRLLKTDGTEAKEKDIQNTKQTIDMWAGIIYSSFDLEGKKVEVHTACHPNRDMIGVTVQSDLIKDGRLSVFLDFPYPDNRQMSDYVGSYSNKAAHTSLQENSTPTSTLITRDMDDANYYVSVNWKTGATCSRESEQSHRFYLQPSKTADFSFTCQFSKEKESAKPIATTDVFEASSREWKDFWLSGAAIDLSGSKDSRWKELERRVVLSQYLMRMNESGLYPSQEAGLVNNGWYGRFHFEMIWWHGVHYGLWNRWSLCDKYLQVYQNYLPTSKERANKQGYKGARWPKCTGDIDRDWPHPIHATLIWQQPHPIYFAEMDYRLHPTRETLDKWKNVVFNSADFMADYAVYDKNKKSYVLGPPIYIVSENTDMYTTQNPAFELGYWRYGLRMAQEWRKRLSLPEEPKWKEVQDQLSPLPVQDGLYVTHEGIQDMWTKFNYEHPALTGIFGMLPGDGVDKDTFTRTLNKVISTWDFNRTWGWDFPMVAMAAARSGNQSLAIDMLLHKSHGFRFDEHGLCTGGPFPYFPANGGLLTAIAMMCGGWDGAEGECPGFPTDGNWSVQAEGFMPMQ